MLSCVFQKSFYDFLIVIYNLKLTFKKKTEMILQFEGFFFFLLFAEYARLSKLNLSNSKVD